ncbi:MAG TPA: hypothetical protein VGB51_09590 [Actinomycetota bacterium]
MSALRTTLVTTLLAGSLSVVPAGPAPTSEAPAAAEAAAAPGAFELVGHEPLFNRGMNAALAVHGDYAYVGSRTDGKPENQNLTHGGIAIVDISNPAAPVVAGEMMPPNEGSGGESSRELRVWRSQDILMVLHTNCGAGNAHLCQVPAVNNFRFYDISGDNAADPELILQFDRNTHEFYLWEDPLDPERALLFAAGAGSSMQIYDLSPLLEGQPPAQLFNGAHGYSGGLHSLSVSNDGTRAYFALLTGGFAIADVSDFTAGRPNPELRRITPSGNRPIWGAPGAHSAIKLWGRDWALAADEVYGLASGGDHGCPWGWARLIDIADPEAPTVEAEYKLPENQASFCEPADTHPFTSFSAHNPTLTPNVALITWHSGGLQAVGLDDPASPVQLAEFKPAPLQYVVTEDPRLSAGQDKVVMWSYPVIQDGLIYVVDLRNGLYILRYFGPHQAEIDQTTFLEGNSNQGHALCFEPVLLPKENPEDPDEYLIPDYCDDRESGPTGSLRLVGHDPLLDRGMNAALAVHGDYAYVGSRTDGKNGNANHAGIMIVDISDPTDPNIVNEMGPPAEANPGESSRELRIWKSQDILIVLHTNCGGASAHVCSAPSVNNFRFYDISGERATDPELILQFAPSTHEFFLWEDPLDPERALLFAAGAGSSMQIYDLSPLLQGQPPTQLFNGGHSYTGGLHSLSVSNDGTRAYFALLTGGFAIADVSDFTAGRPSPELRRVTLSGSRPTWSGPGAHSAIKLWGRDWALVADEVYGTATGSAHGCPWGWARLIDIADPEAPTVQAEYKLPQNRAALCSSYEPRPTTSFSAHNPTLTPNIAFVTWHSGGLQAISLEDPAAPYQLAEFMPEPLPVVGTEDPRLSAGVDKVVMWSYPIIEDGLIYVADLRNGLYILEYEGPFEDEVSDTGFLEGNSNQGEALCFEPVLLPKESPEDPDEFLVPEDC